MNINLTQYFCQSEIEAENDFNNMMSAQLAPSLILLIGDYEISPLSNHLDNGSFFNKVKNDLSIEAANLLSNYNITLSSSEEIKLFLYRTGPLSTFMIGKSVLVSTSANTIANISNRIGSIRQTSISI